MAEATPYKILHVEDNRADAMVVRRLLSELGFRADVETVDDGSAALQWLHSHREPGFRQADIVLLDLNLPRLSGHDLLARIKDDERLRAIPVVVLTSSTSDMEAASCFSSGANGYITKSSNLETYRRKLRSVMEIWASRDGGEPPGETAVQAHRPVATDGGDLRVLIVDDSRADAELTRRYLALSRRWRISCEIVSDPEAASERLRHRDVDILFIDHHMPGRTGVDYLREIRSTLNDAGIVVLTGQGDERVAALATRYGADDYLAKMDLSGATLEQAIAVALSKANDRRVIHTDGLTGLYNRRAFDQRLSEELSRSVRYGGVFCLMLVDLDHFKEINDSYGHVTGDRLLAQLGEVFRNSLRDTDFAARFGGDEFCIIAPETDSEEACNTARRLCERVSETVFRGSQAGMVLRLSCSIGVVRFAGGEITDVSTALERADEAMYRVKQQGGNSVHLLDDLGE